MDFTKEQIAEFYGITYEGNREVNIPNWKPDFTKWVAVKRYEDDGEVDWCISPKVFWEAKRCIPDHCISFRVPGFYEAAEHELLPCDPAIDEEEALRSLGFEVITDPKWWYSHE